MTTGFVLEALNPVICQRTPSEADSLTHHSDRGSQYLSTKYTERRAKAGIDPCVGSVADSYDNALAESTIGLFKTEVIDFIGSLEIRRRGQMGTPEMGDLVWAQNTYTAKSDTSHHKKQRRTSMKP